MWQISFPGPKYGSSAREGQKVKGLQPEDWFALGLSLLCHTLAYLILASGMP